MDIKIRLMQEKDLMPLSKVYTLVYKKFDIGEKWTEKTSKKLLEYWFDKQPDLAFVAELDGQIVGGFVAGIKPWWDGNHMSDGEVFVHPDYQKKALPLNFLLFFMKRPLKIIMLSVSMLTHSKRQNSPLSWYLSQGFIQNEDWTMISGDVKSILLNLKNKNLKK